MISNNHGRAVAAHTRQRTPHAGDRVPVPHYGQQPGNEQSIRPNNDRDRATSHAQHHDPPRQRTRRDGRSNDQPTIDRLDPDRAGLGTRQPEHGTARSRRRRAREGPGLEFDSAAIPTDCSLSITVSTSQSGSQARASPSEAWNGRSRMGQ